MKKFYILILFTISFYTALAQINSGGQNKIATVTTIPLSTSPNVFSTVGVKTQLWADDPLNEIIFIHRMAADSLAYDISKDEGATWTINHVLLNDTSLGKVRYPQAAIVNPSGVQNQDSAYVTFLSPLTNGTDWTGVLNGQKQIVAGSTTTSTFTNDTTLHHLIPTGFIATKQGTTWSVDAQVVYNGSSWVYNHALTVTKGTWNSLNREFDYTTQILQAPVMVAGLPKYQECNIAFSPDGQTGYVVMNGHSSSAFSNDSVYFPTVYKTTDGGQTWGAPVNIGLAAIESMLSLGTIFYTMGSQFDVAVDASGSLHIFCEILEGNNNWGGYITYQHWGVFDISTFGTSAWQAELIGLPQTYQGVFGITGSTTNPPVTECGRPQVSIDSSGMKVFFSWFDTDTATFGILENLFPDMHLKGYDIITHNWTNEINVTAGTDADGRCAFGNVSYYALTSGGNYILPATFSELMDISQTGSPATHYYLSGVTIGGGTFTVSGNAVALDGFGSSYSKSGIIYYDANDNGIKDGAEPGLYAKRINVQPDGFSVFTNSLGDYRFYDWVTGSHTVTCTVPPGWHISSDSLSYIVLDDTLNQTGFDFGIFPDTLVHSLSVSAVGSFPRCNNDVSHWIDYENTGTIVENGTIKFVLDPAVTFVSSAPPPDATAGDTLIWNFTLLFPYSTGQIHLFLHMPPTAGDTLHYQTIIEADSSGVTVFAAEEALQEIVRCSYDPNDKRVTPEGVEASHYTLYSDTLKYTIRFQNTGNDTAFTVVIRDTISSSLDVNTLRIIGSSRPVSVTLFPANVLEFRFDNILLPDSGIDEPGSNGFVQYSIQTQSGITLPVDVNNTAYIYFDFNAAVQTNTTTNQLVLVIPTSVQEISSAKSMVKVVPNPFHTGAEIFVNDIRFTSSTTLKVMNALGEIIFIQKIENGNQKISGNNLRQGIYFFELKNKSGESLYGKFIIE